MRERERERLTVVFLGVLHEKKIGSVCEADGGLRGRDLSPLSLAAVSPEHHQVATQARALEL